MLELRTNANYDSTEVANIIVNYLPVELVNFYSEFKEKNGIPLQEELGDLFSSADLLILSYNIEDVILYLLETTGAEYTEVEAYNQAKLLKKNRKDYIFRGIKEELGLLKSKPNNPKYIEREWEMLNTPMMLDLPSNPAKGVSLSSFKKMRFEEISSWFNDSDSSLFQFKYFSSLSMKRQILCLVQDISWNVFKIINQEFYRNKLGFITKTPDMSLGIENAPIFSFQASRLQLQFEAKDDKINIFETIKTNTEQEIRLWVGEYPCDCSDEENVKNTILKLESEFNKGIRKKTLDTKDYDVFTNVFNNMPMSSVTTLDGSFGIDLKDFVTDIYANNSHFKSQPKNIYKDTLERLNKLATYHISHSRQDENGRIIAAGTKYFFELDIIPIDNEHFNSSGRTINTIKVSDSVSDFDWSNYSVKDFENLHLKFSPSNSMKELWTEGMHSAIISKAYKQVSDHKGRFIIQFLHAERMKCYPELSKKLPLSYIKTKMRYAKNTSERVKKEMAEEMDKFKGQYVIKDYHFERGYLCLEFLPLSKEECIIYKIPYDDSNDKNILI